MKSIFFLIEEKMKSIFKRSEKEIQAGKKSTAPDT